MITVNSTLREDARHFEGLEWTQVTAEDWRRYGDAFFGLSPEAFIYFLPSLLLVSLEQANLPLEAADALVSSLDTSADPDIWPGWFVERFSMLALPELKALKDWAAVYLDWAETGEGSETARVRDTLAMLQMGLEN